MAEFLTGRRIVDAIQTSLTATDRADFAVAYWGLGATERLGLDKTNKPVRILCDITRLSCHPKELQKLLDYGFQLKTKTGFHAKVYLTSRKVVIGSANASTNGLGDPEDEIESELEAAVIASDEKTIEGAREWFNRHWDDPDSVEVTKTLVDQIGQLWKSRPRAPSLLSLLVNSPELFVRMPIRLVLFEDNDKGEYDSAWKEIKKAKFYSKDDVSKYDKGRSHPFYLVDLSSRWSMSDGEYVVSFWAKQVKQTGSYKLTREGGFWRYKTTTSVKINGKSTKVILADETKIIAGLRFPERNYNVLQKCVRDYVSQRKSLLKLSILLDVRLGDLPSAYPSIFSDLKVATNKHLGRTSK